MAVDDAPGNEIGLRFGPIGEAWLHVCVDMQRMFAEATPWTAAWMPRVLPNVVRLSERGPEHTLFTRFVSAAGGGRCRWNVASLLPALADDDARAARAGAVGAGAGARGVRAAGAGARQAGLQSVVRGAARRRARGAGGRHADRIRHGDGGVRAGDGAGGHRPWLPRHRG